MIDFGSLPKSLLIVLIIVGVLILSALVAFVWFVLVCIIHLHFQNKNNDDDANMNLSADIAYFYEKGKRERQEDSYFVSPLEQYNEHGIIACISDGMGGLSYGDEISKQITDFVASKYPYDFLKREETADEIQKLSNEIFEKYNRKGGATFAMVHIFENQLNVFSVGDSDIILIREGRSTILNPKQNYISVLIADLVRQGKTAHEAYVNKRARALVDYMGNSNPKVNFTHYPIKLFDGDTIIVCSDGVTDALPYYQMPRYVTYDASQTASNYKAIIRSKSIPRQDNYTGIFIQLSRNRF